jgi:hypothetical protein
MVRGRLPLRVRSRGDGEPRFGRTYVSLALLSKRPAQGGDVDPEGARGILTPRTTPPPGHPGATPPRPGDGAPPRGRFNALQTSFPPAFSGSGTLAPHGPLPSGGPRRPPNGARRGPPVGASKAPRGPGSGNVGGSRESRRTRPKTAGPAEGGHDERACGVPHPDAVPTPPSAVHRSPRSRSDGGGWRSPAPDGAVQRPPPGPRVPRRPAFPPASDGEAPRPSGIRPDGRGVGGNRDGRRRGPFTATVPQAPWGRRGPPPCHAERRVRRTGRVEGSRARTHREPWPWNGSASRRNGRLGDVT